MNEEQTQHEMTNIGTVTPDLLCVVHVFKKNNLMQTLDLHNWQQNLDTD